MIDPRAYSATKLIAPPPLPAISRKRLRKVLNPIPAPTECRYCGGPVKLVNNSVLYRKPFGKWPYMYLCVPCDAYVGLHPGTDIPLGTLANKALRDVRKEHKATFYELIERLGIDRTEAYERLAEKMKIPHADCHFGWFDIEQCELAGRICRAALEVAP